MIIPETPRWLAAHDQPEKALEVLKQLKDGILDEAAIVQMHNDIVQTVSMEASVGAGSWKDLLKNDQIQSQRRFLIACAIQIFQQLGGINAIICECASAGAVSVRIAHEKIRLLQHPVPEVYWVRQPYVRSNVGVSPDVVLPCLLHSLVPN
jgi:Sugar (and other) transporter